MLAMKYYYFTIGSRSFKTSWPIFILVAIAFSALMKLGFWQLHRADEKRQILATYDARMQAAAQKLTQEHLTKRDFKFLPISVTGQLDNQHQFLLDNQYSDHQIGYHVITAIGLSKPDIAVLVDRGWITSGEKRDDLPKIDDIEGTITLEGRIYYPEKGVVLGDDIDQSLAGWPKRIQRINFPELEQLLDYKLAPFILRLNPEQSYGFKRHWEVVNMPPSRHLGYAIQWFGLAITLIIVYISASSRRKDSEKRGKQD